MHKITNLKLSVYEDESALRKKVAKALSVSESEIKYLKITKKSLDARKKNDLHFVYSVEASLNEFYDEKPKYEIVDTNKKVVVVGFGPAGMFCALNLARRGIKTVVIERGEEVLSRAKTIEKFISGDKLNVESNVQFGEGGAGTFSDGKLNTQVNNRLIGDVLRDFVSFGAPEEIAYLSKPHVGSDKLKQVVLSLRREFISLGGEIHFNTKLEDVIINKGRVCCAKTNRGEISCDYLVLAIGHSARDTFEMLYKKQFDIEQKEFAVGFRVEQLQQVIDKWQYGKFYGEKSLMPADFKLVSHVGGRGVFTFCMCPGGEVVPATSEEGQVVTNGMSNFKRDMENANSAIICQVKKSDFSNGGVLDGMYFQRELEKKAFLLGGENYNAPIQLASDFVNDRQSTALSGVKPSYRRGYRFAELKNLFPKQITDCLRGGLVEMDKKINGIASKGAVLTGVESRTSSPIRILRNDLLECVTYKGIYPCGEGCGYAGGIMSAAIDGIKVSQKIIEDVKLSG